MRNAPAAHLIVVLAGTLALAVGSMALGAGKKGEVKTGKKREYNNQNQAPAAEPAKTDPPRLVKSNPNVEAVNNAEAAFQKVDANIRDQFSNSPEMKAAIEAQHVAQQSMDAAAADVMKKLIADPNYTAAVSKRDGSQAQLDQLRSTGTATDAQIASAAAEVMNYGSVATKLKADAERNDMTWAAARAALTEASAKVLAQRKQFEESLPSNTEWAAAKKNLDDARTKLAQH